MKTLILFALMMSPSLFVPAYAAHAEEMLFVAPEDAQPAAPVGTLAFLEPRPMITCDIVGKPSQNWTLIVRNRKYAGQREKHSGSFNMMSALRDHFCPDDI